MRGARTSHELGSEGNCEGRWTGGVRAAAGTLCALALVTVAMLVAAAAALAEKPIEKPVNTSPPSISGKAVEGDTLKAKEGKWTGGDLSYSFQWQRCEPECSNVPGATSNEYTLYYVDVGSKLRVIVLAKNSAGEAEATSEETAEVLGVAPKSVEAPEISGAGSEGPEEGQVLSVSEGKWSGSPGSYKYQWEVCGARKCSEIEGATDAKYRVSKEDVGDTLRAVVTDTNVAGSRSADSAQTATVIHGPPVPAGYPTVTGTLREGGTLTAVPGTWYGVAPIEYAYTWERCSTEGSCTVTAESTAPTYTLGAGDVGSRIRVKVTAHNERGSASSTSVATQPVLGESDDFAVAWGEDWEGQLGTNYRIFEGWEESPVLMEGETGVTALAAGGSVSLALHSDGTVSASGGGFYGGTGNGGRKASWEEGESHVAVKGISEAVKISAGEGFGMALLGDGDVEAWGNNAHGTLGNGKGGFEAYTGENQLEPKEVKALHGREVVSIASGAGANFAVLADGELVAWGRNHYGELGIEWPEECDKLSKCETGVENPFEEAKKGEPITEPEHKCYFEVGWEQCSRVPEPVVKEKHPIQEVAAVSARDQDTFALLKDGEVLSWGNDHFDGLAQTREPAPHSTFIPPAPVMASKTEQLKHVVAIAAGNNGGLALLEDGQLMGWGDDSGALGETSEQCTAGHKVFACDRYATPISSPSGVSIKAIGAGGGYSVVLGSEGKVYTIGTNAMGELGRGPGCEEGGGEMGLYEPCYSRRWEAVPGLADVQAISAGLRHVLALVGPEGAPPQPVVANESEPQSLKLAWALPNDELAESVVYRVWESPGEGEASEGEGPPEEEEEETGTGEPPTNTTLPRIKVTETVEQEGKPVEKHAVSDAVGDKAKGSSGNWSGTPPIKYEYQWLKCKNGKCTAIAGAVAPEYVIAEEDAGYTLEFQVTARNGVAPHGVATSEPTEVIKAEEEGRSSKAEKIKVAGQDGVLLESLDGAPLEPIQYEVKLTAQAAAGVKNKTRQMVLQPLP